MMKPASCPKKPLAIAVTGIGGIFPGADNLDQFWKMIEEGKSAVAKVPDGRWPEDAANYHHSQVGRPDSVLSPNCCAIRTIPQNYNGINLPDSLIRRLDPLFQITLQAGRDAFFSTRRENLDLSRVQVILANIVLPTDTTSEITRKLFNHGLKTAGKPENLQLESALDVEALNRLSAELPAGLLAAALGVGGGCYTLDAACASSLYAIKLACEELIAGRADAVLTGGVSRPSSQFTQMGFSQLRALSSSGICRPFDEKADGLIVGEGAGIFVLKRLDDAVAAGDQIHAVIRGIGLANDVGGSLLAPDTEGQLRAMHDAYSQAGWEPDQVQLVECHGTGTPKGDAVEFDSLRQLWQKHADRRDACVIGSVKSNVGHLLTGAGAAGLMKLIFALKNHKLPPTANFSKPDPNMNMTSSPFTVLRTARDWQPLKPGMPRRCALSAFGFGGIDAHVLLEEFIPGTTKVEKTEIGQCHDDVVIVSLAARAGKADNLYEIQQALLNGSSLADELPAERHSLATNEKWLKTGSYIKDLKISFGRFKISPKEFPEILPQQLLMLQTVDEAIGRLTGTRPAGVRHGVFMGINLDFDSTNFAARWSLKSDMGQSGINDLDSVKETLTPALNHARTVGALGGIVASRIAREYQCGGPSHTFSAAENSGLAAMEAAVRSLQRGETDAAIVGAVDMAGDLRNLLICDRLRPFSRNGKARPFSRNADGPTPGEGAVALVLKRKSDALRDGDRIMAVIKGMGKASRQRHSDQSAGIDANLRAMRQAWNEARLNPENLGLLEADGSANPASDLVEAEAFSRFFEKKKSHNSFQQNDQLCALACAKTVTGYTGASSGLFSLARAAIALYQQVLPANPGLEDPIEPLAGREDFFFTPSRPQYWLRNRVTGPRIAAVNGHGLDGSAWHMVLAEFDETGNYNPEIKQKIESERVFASGAPKDLPFIVEGDTICELREKLSALRNLKSESFAALARDYHNQSRKLPQAALAVALVADNPADLQRRAEFALNHINNNAEAAIAPGPEVNDRIFFNPKPVGRDGKIAFVFPGSGNHFLGMGVDLGLTWSEFPRRLDEQFELLAAQYAPRRIVPWRLSWPADWEDKAMRDLIDDHNSLVFSHVSTCALISDIVRNFGIQPEIVMGYSLGETAGNFATRTWRERDEMVKRMRASALFTTELIGRYDAPRQHWGLGPNEKIEWSLGVIHCPAREVEKHLPDFKQTYVLIENTAGECVIGGNKVQVEALARKIGKAFFPLDGVSSVHCPAALPVADQYRALHLYDCHPPDGMTFISSGLGTTFKPERDRSADSIKAQCIGPINFPRCVETAWENGARVFLELGPRSSMSRMITSILGDRRHFARSAMLFGQNQNSSLIRFLANLASERVAVDFSPVFKNSALQITTTKEDKAKIMVPVGHRIDFSKVSRPAAKAAPSPAPQVMPAPIPAAASPVPAAPAIIAAPAPVMQPAPQPLKTMEVQAMNHQNAPASEETNIIRGWLSSQQATAKAHEAFLSFSNRMAAAQALLLQQQINAMEGLSNEDLSSILSAPIENQTQATAYAPAPAAAQSAMPAQPHQIAALQPVYKFSRSQKMPKAYTGPVILDEKLSMEFATGLIGKALGEFFAPIDKNPTRVRLPDIPLNFVDRITLIEGEKGSLGKGRVITEHDVYPNTWYLDNDCMPTGLAVEAGQADLFLSGWLGIDFKTKGIAKYRLLDAVVTFHGPLPRPGDTIHYDIRVDRFIRQADTYLFFFEFDGSIDGKHLITMRNGCAGFFTDKQLADGKGIVLTADDIKPEPKPDLPGRELLPAMVTESFGKEELDALRRGDLGAAFGGAFTGLQIRPQTLPDGRMKMIDRITEISPRGGRFGLGQIKAEIDIPDKAWFLTQHFCDDQVMPGTLMYESCMQSMRVFLLRMGWVADAEIAAFEPVPNIQSQLRCRGQVIPGVKKALYEISIKEMGYNPEPYALADALMFADGNRIVQVLNMSIRLSGANRQMIENLWAAQSGQAAPVQPSDILPAIYTGQQILEYAIGRPSVCFGDKFKPFDSEKFLARLPNPPYLFVDRITAVDAEFLKIKTGGHVQGQFDIRPDHWFFRANRQSSIPFSVLLEFPLQVCGWYSCFMGSAFTNDKQLHYRNLDGVATLYEDITTGSGTLTADVYSTKAANSAGMLIQSFKFVVTRQGRKVYDGETTFGFFSVEALANQVGLRGVNLYEPDAAEKARARSLPFADCLPILPEDSGLEAFDGLIMPGKAYKMLDSIDMFISDGGPAKLGFVRGTKKVNPADWFFKAHFYQDPVIPGSLGLESFLQLLRAVAIDRWGSELQGRSCHFEPIAVNQKHVWSYRGQVIPKDDLVTVDACITRIDDANHLIVADGFLKVDGRIIYSMKDFALRVATT